VVVSVATPLPFSVPVPRTAAPFLKVTVPEGTPPKAPWTVAVKVTAWCHEDGFAEDVTVVVDAALLTTCVNRCRDAGDIFSARPVDPDDGMAANAQRVGGKRRTPPLSGTVATTTPLFLNATLPSGVAPKAGVTVALKVTD